MVKTTPKTDAGRLVLDAATAADLMTPNPVSIRADATVAEAVAFLTDKGFSAAPVIDEAGRPVGVLSRSDIVVHDREQSTAACQVSRKKLASFATTGVPEYFERPDLVLPAEASAAGEPTRVRDLMTPVVFSVSPEASARRVVEDMTALRVHRLFVVDRDGVLVGVISALDVLRHLRPESAVSPARAAGETLRPCGEPG